MTRRRLRTGTGSPLTTRLTATSTRRRMRYISTNSRLQPSNTGFVLWTRHVRPGRALFFAVEAARGAALAIEEYNWDGYLYAAAGFTCHCLCLLPIERAVPRR